MSRKVTIKDVAKKAGVSISTVSNALNDVDVLHPDTKKHILDVARELHYVPNVNGRNLKSQETRVIGLFLNSIAGPYYGILADSIYRTCQQYGYELNIFISEKAKNAMSDLLGHRVDGAIIMSGAIRDKEVELLQEYETPIVFIDREQKGKRMSSVIFDSYHEGEMAAEYLLGLGHRSFWYINGAENTFDNTKRRQGFVAVLSKAGILLGEDCILEGRFERACAYESVKKAIEDGRKPPDAIFAANDLSAIGAVEALLDQNIAVPGQVSVIGCDDIEMARMVRPSITTLCTSFEKQGSMAVHALLRLIRGENEGSIEILYGSVTQRESTSAKPDFSVVLCGEE